MMQFIFLLVCALGGMDLMAQQLVNFEETWQEFLKKDKISNISKLVQPDRAQKESYIKYALMYANTYFCADNIESADEMIKRIEKMGTEVQEKVDGFAERYQKVLTKINAYKDFVPLWKKFQSDPESVSNDELALVNEAKSVCEKGTLCKYFLINAHNYFCDEQMTKARNLYDTRIKKLMQTDFDYKVVEGLDRELEKMLEFWPLLDELDLAWQTYEITGVSPGFEKELPFYKCNVLPYYKICILNAKADFCANGEKVAKEIIRLKTVNQDPIPAEILDQLNWIEENYEKERKDLAVLNSYWRIFTPKDKLPEQASFKYHFNCDKEAEIRGYLMIGINDPCNKAKFAIDSIEMIKKVYQPALEPITNDKYKKLKSLLTEDESIAVEIDQAWNRFLKEEDFNAIPVLEKSLGYCNKLSEIKYYIMDGTINYCEKGQIRLDDITRLLDEFKPELSEDVIDAHDALDDLVFSMTSRQDVLQRAWNHYKQHGEVSYDIEYTYDFPCDRLNEVRAYLLDGYTDPCLSGEYALGEISKLMQKYSLQIPDELQKMMDVLQQWPIDDQNNTEVLNKAWNDFDKDGKLEGPVNFVFEYCDKIAQAKAYIIDGTVNFDTNAEARLRDMRILRTNYLLKLNRPMLKRLEWLQNAVEEAQ